MSYTIYTYILAFTLRLIETDPITLFLLQETWPCGLEPTQAHWLIVTAICLHCLLRVLTC